LPWELRVLAGCVLHGFRYRCGNGILLTAHSAGRLRQWIAR
jgi:translation initiation factor IF-1